MQIIINNPANIANKYIRFVKWKIYRLAAKYKSIDYCHIYISAEGNHQPQYKAIVKLGVPGEDIILTHKHASLKKLFKATAADMERYLRKWKNKNSVKTNMINLSELIGYTQ